MRYPCSPSPLTAIEAWVLLSSGCSPRAFRHTSQPQFHCGTPPPAAAPRTTTRSMIRLLAFQRFELRSFGPRTFRATNISKVDTSTRTIPVRERATPGGPPASNVKLTCRLLAGGARIHVDFHVNRYFDDLWGLPGHCSSPFQLGRNPPYQ